jgi:hypothetical protein
MLAGREPQPPRAGLVEPSGQLGKPLGLQRLAQRDLIHAADRSGTDAWTPLPLRAGSVAEE